MEMDIYREYDMLHHIATISVCYGGHFESKMTAKIKNHPIWVKFGTTIDMIESKTGL